MIRKILCLILFFAVLTGYAQDSIRSNGYTIFYYPTGVKSSEGNMVNGQPDGWWKSYNEKGGVISEGNRKNSLIDSLWTFYNDKGEKVLEVTYKAGKKDGPRIQYLPDEYIVENWVADTLKGDVISHNPEGWVKKRTPYVDGKPHGLEKEYDKTGLVIGVTEYYRGILTRREYINKTDKFGFKQGNWKFFWDNGNLKQEGTYLNDKKNGFFKEYDENGNFVSVAKYENDRLIEDAKETKLLDRKTAYHPNGQPSITATYYKEIPHGIRREYDTSGVIIKGYVFDNGVLRYEGITDLEGRRQGLWKEYYETGELRSEGRYKNSNPVGVWKFYFPDKKIEITGAYNDRGRKDGEWKWYYPNGNTLMIEEYLDGKLEGEFIEYDENEEIIAQGIYIEDQEDSVWFYRHGAVIEKGSYYDGMRTGVWKTWFGDGKLASEISFDQDLPDGKYTVYWENGMVKLTGKYITGKRTGIWYQYDEEGRLFLTTQYRDGVEVRWDNYKLPPLPEDKKAK